MELASSSLRVVVDVGRGGQIVHVGLADGPNVLFHEPWLTPVPSGPWSGYGDEALDWLSHYRGGWQVMFPNAGSGCIVEGVPLPLHGEVSWTRPLIVERGPDHLVLTSPTRRPLTLRRRIELDPGAPVLHIVERVTSDAAWPLPYVWGQHPAFHAVAGALIDLPVGEVHVDEAFDDPAADLAPGAVGIWPCVRGRDGGDVDLSLVPEGSVERVCYLPERPAAWAAVRNVATGSGVALTWERTVWPHLWLWQQIGGPRFPFFGRGRIVALEPTSCWPADGLGAAIARGRASLIEAAGTAEAWVTLSLFTATMAPVLDVRPDGRVVIAD